MITEQKDSICSTCLHSGHCQFQRDSRKPIYDCNEFELPIPEQDGVVLDSTVEKAGGTIGRMVGLCANCENRNTCMSADTVTGIWYCEDYR